MGLRVCVHVRVCARETDPSLVEVEGWWNNV